MNKEKSLENIIENFNKEVEGAVSSKRSLWENQEEDEIYNVDIHIWRKSGMGNSLQTIIGNKLSVMTATCSFLGTLLDKKVITEEELDFMINEVKKLNKIK